MLGLSVFFVSLLAAPALSIVVQFYWQLILRKYVWLPRLGSYYHHKLEDKLGLSWAKLSSSWDWTLLKFSVDLVPLDLVFILQVRLKRFDLVYFLLYISNILLQRFIFVDFVCRLGLLNMVQKIWLGPQGKFFD